MYKDNKSTGGTLGGVATYTSIVGGISALGNFVLNLIGWGGAAEQLFWLQILPFAAFLLAFCTVAVDYEMKRELLGDTATPRVKSRLETMGFKQVVHKTTGRKTYFLIDRTTLEYHAKQYNIEIDQEDGGVKPPKRSQTCTIEHAQNVEGGIKTP